jgi:hypothetical protein
MLVMDIISLIRVFNSFGEIGNTWVSTKYAFHDSTVAQGLEYGTQRICMVRLSTSNIRSSQSLAIKNATHDGAGARKRVKATCERFAYVEITLFTK